MDIVSLFAIVVSKLLRGVIGPSTPMGRSSMNVPSNISPSACIYFPYIRKKGGVGRREEKVEKISRRKSKSLISISIPVHVLSC